MHNLMFVADKSGVSSMVDWGVRYKYNHKHRGNQIIKSISEVFVSRKHVDQILLKK